MNYKSAKEHANDIIEGKVTSESLTTAYFERIEQYNSEINAIVISDVKAALERARGLDKDLAAGKVAGPLHGVPVTVKEAFNMKGLKTTVNFTQLKNNIAKEDSYYVTQLLEAGAVILGKTNVPTMLSDTQTFGPLYPTANNPYNLNKTPGGSTGGGAAAVATGLTTFEIGSDIGGSIRNPAHYCGLFGLKPTENNHPQDGHVPLVPNSKSGYISMSSVGPLARSVEDIELAWSIIGKPRWDYLQMLPVKHKLVNKPEISNYKIGWYDTIGAIHCGSETKAILDKFVENLIKKGAEVNEIKLESSWINDVFEIWASLFGVIMGQDAPWIIRQIMKLQFTKMGKGSRLSSVKYIKKGLDLNFKYFSKTLKKRQERLADLNKIFDQYDFIISPTSVGPAFDHNHKHKPISIDSENMAYLDYCFPFAMPYNAMGNPVMVFPAGQSADGLPIGLQIAGPHYTEDQLIHFSKMVEELGYSFKAPEGYKN